MNAPDFTGERFVPGQGGARIAYEHLHRYYYARRWADSGEVLDVAAGTGYGAALLGRVARRVWLIDIDGASIRHARGSYGADNLEFLQGDATRLPLRSRSVDLAVAFEVLEHVGAQEELVSELARVVRDRGTVLISTPNKAAYSDARGYRNPYHVRELYQDEFVGLLRRHFPSVRLLTQQVRSGSLIGGETGSAGGQIICEPVSAASAAPPMYFLAHCALQEDAADLAAASAFLDSGDFLALEWEREFARLNDEVERLGAWSRGLENQVRVRDRMIRELQETLRMEMARRDEAIRRLQAEVEEHNRWALRLEGDVEARDQALHRLQEEFDGRTRWALELTAEVAARDGRLRHTQDELDRVAGHLARIRRARMYRILCRLGIVPR